MASQNLQSAATNLGGFNGTVNHSANAARNASRLAATATDTATRRGELVNRVAQRMDINIATASVKARLRSMFPA